MAYAKNRYSFLSSLSETGKIWKLIKEDRAYKSGMKLVEYVSILITRAALLSRK